MTKTIVSFSGFLMGLAMLVASGCADVKVTAPPQRALAADATYRADAQSDTRTPAQLQADNAQLRSQVQKLESDHEKWQKAVDARENQKRDLKRQRSDVEKQRDQYKKMLGD